MNKKLWQRLLRILTLRRSAPVPGRSNIESSNRARLHVSRSAAFMPLEYPKTRSFYSLDAAGCSPSLPRSGGEGRGEEALIAQVRDGHFSNAAKCSPSPLNGERAGVRGGKVPTGLLTHLNSPLSIL